MPRSRITRVSISSEQSSNSDHSDIHNVIDEFPDPGLAICKYKDAKDKVSLNFACDVITKSGDKLPGMGVVDLTDSMTSLEKPLMRKTKAELKEIVPHPDDLIQEDKQLVLKKNFGRKKQIKPPNNIGNQNSSKIQKKNDVQELKEVERKKEETKKLAIKDATDNMQIANIENHYKFFKPEESMKYITLLLHPELAEARYMQPTVQHTELLGARVLADPGVHCGLLQYTRTLPQNLINDKGQAAVQQCGRVLCVVQADTLAGQDHWLDSIMNVTRSPRLAGASFSMLVIGFNELYKKLPHSGTQLTKKKLAKLIGELQIKMLMSARMELVAVETPADLAILVGHYTRGVAEEPYKKAKRDIDEQADFYMKGDNKNCVTVDKEGNGVSRLWEQMLAVLPQSSLEVARTLGAAYKTPAALLQELQAPSLVGVSKLANIGIARTNVPGAKARRLGPEFARKLHTLFTTEDGDTVIE